MVNVCGAKNKERFAYARKQIRQKQVFCGIKNIKTSLFFLMIGSAHSCKKESVGITRFQWAEKQRSTTEFQRELISGLQKKIANKQERKITIKLAGQKIVNVLYDETPSQKPFLQGIANCKLIPVHLRKSLPLPTVY